MKQSILESYIPTMEHFDTKKPVKMLRGKKVHEKIKLPRAKNVDRFEIKEYVKKYGLSKEIDRAIQTAFYLGVPVEQICNNFSVNYGTDGSVLITADTHIDIRAKTQEQKEKLLEAIREESK